MGTGAFCSLLVVCGDDWQDVGNLYHAETVVEELCVLHRMLDVLGGTLAVVFICLIEIIGKFLKGSCLHKLAYPIRFTCLYQIFHIQIILFEVSVVTCYAVCSHRMQSVVFSRQLESFEIVVQDAFVGRRAEKDIFSLQILVISRLLALFVEIIKQDSHIVLLLGFEFVYKFRFGSVRFPVIEQPRIGEVVIQLLFVGHLLRVECFQDVFRLAIESSHRQHGCPVYLKASNIKGVMGSFCQLESFSHIGT